MSISGEGVLLWWKWQMQRPCGRCKEQEEGLWAGAQGAKGRAAGNALREVMGADCGASWTAVGTLPFPLSDMVPWESAEQGRDVTCPGVHRHPLQHAGKEEVETQEEGCRHDAGVGRGGWAGPGRRRWNRKKWTGMICK